MVHIKIKKGLDIPVDGQPLGSARPHPASPVVLFDFSPFKTVHPHLLVKEGDPVLIGQPLIQDKRFPGRIWASPGAGIVEEILRGEKRALVGIKIRSGEKLEFFALPPAPQTKEGSLDYLAKTGLLAYCWTRPFHVPALPQLVPRSIFVKAVESAPFAPPAEMQVEGKREVFQAGLDFLSLLAPVHLVYRKGTQSGAFLEAKSALHHTVEGPHPAGNPSLHIQRIDPIEKATDIVWTLDAWSVVAIGHAALSNRFYNRRIVSLAGAGVLPEHRGYYEAHIGASFETLTKNRLRESAVRLISGDPLMGEAKDFLGFSHSICCAIEKSSKREVLHFLRIGEDRYTASRTYFSFRKFFSFNTLLHGEERAFIDPNVYDRVMPIQVPTALLVKAVIAEDFERAEALGLLEVAPEDFALPTFVCPSKIEMVEIIENGLKRHAADSLSM
ncbi:MAG: NADH:ubiquinone reductase (Na(+)-transporting) subunit A [Chlamydiae bacterium RIFCSPHIGHO2_12_FULL_49_9]|nr:MAG: NADH:ubiquinone reductase (Na(+)-transporting) subunit A [Chlamydiae bacterium RIFCSPHIGHO2_12_FULL_49_9]